MMTDPGDGAGTTLHPRTCPACGDESAATARFCGSCGEKLSLESVAESSQQYRRRIGGTQWAPSNGVHETRETSYIESLPGSTRSSGSGRARKRRRRRTPWFKRRLVMIPLVLLVLVGGAAGALAYRAQSTLNSIQEVSELPPQVTDSTVGDETESLPSDIVFDTEPARLALIEAGMLPDAESGGVFGGFKDAAGDVGDLASGAAIAAGVKDPSKDAITVLVMGVDARPGAPIDIGVRPDAIMVLYLNPVSGVCRGLAIPRDTLVELPGYGATKVNHALMLAGIPYQQLVVENFLGIQIDHYALIDFTGFKELVDAVGGVSVNVPTELKNGERVLFEAGPQTFDGDQALNYARYRGEADADVGRVRRQQQIIRGLVQVSIGRNIASDVNQLLPAVKNHVRTDLSSSELVSLAEQYRAKCSDASLEMDTLQGNIISPDTLDPVYQTKLVYSEIDPALVKEKVANLTRN